MWFCITGNVEQDVWFCFMAIWSFGIRLPLLCKTCVIHARRVQDVWFCFMATWSMRRVVLMLATWSSCVKSLWNLRWFQLRCVVFGIGGCAALWC